MLNRKAWVSAGILAAGFSVCAWPQRVPPPHTLIAGPAYMSVDGRNGPKFPRVDILVRVAGAPTAPSPAPGDLSLYSGNAEVGLGISVRSFGDAGYGLKAILALDASGSMSGAPLMAVRSSIARFVNDARPQDQVEVISFANKTRIDVPFGSSSATLAKALEQIGARGTQTHLYDALLDGLTQLAGGPVRKQLIVISDGHDEGSTHTMDDVIHRAVALQIPIDAVGLTRSLPEYLRVLARLSEATGGKYHLAKSPQELASLVGGEIQAVRSAPVVTFDLKKLNADGATHPLDLRWRPEGLDADIAISTPSAKVTDTAIWAWVLGGCFAAGAVLLLVSFWRFKRQSALPSRYDGLAPKPQREAAPTPPRPAGLGLTETETEDVQPAIRKYIPTKRDPAAGEARSKTQIAAFFNSADGVPYLDAIAGPLAGKSFSVPGTLRIGAQENNDLVIEDDPTLSGTHARLILGDSILMIEDLRSTNGTFVNGLRLGPDRKLLKPGDKIRVGRSEFVLRAR